MYNNLYLDDSIKTFDNASLTYQYDKYLGILSSLLIIKFDKILIIDITS